MNNGGDILGTGHFVSQPASNYVAPQQQNHNWLLDLLAPGGSLGGGLGGAALGAAAGSVVPGLGTGIGALLGGIIGGAGGGALGKADQNALSGNKDLGQGVAQEALMGGLTSVPIGSALKLGQAGFKVATGLGGKSVADLLAEAGGKAIPQAFAQGAEQTAANTAGQIGTDAMGSVLNPTLTQKVGNALENAGTNQLVKNQVNLTRAGQAKINGGDINGLFKQMQNDYGLTNLNDMNQVGQLVTGKAGLDNGGAALTNAVEQAVASGKGINIDDLKSLLNDRIDQAGAALTPADKTALNNQVSTAVKSMLDQTAAKGANTGPSSLVDPLAALNQARALSGNAATFLERNPNIITSRDQALGGIYNGLASDIKDRLFNTQGAIGQTGVSIQGDAQRAVDDAVTGLRQEAQKYLAAGNKTIGNAINAVADKAANAKTISDLNAIQSPFVNTSKLGDLNGLTGGGAAANVGGDIKNTATGMLNSAAGELVAPAINSAAAGTSSLGKLLAGAGGSGLGDLASGAGGQTLQSAAWRNAIERAPGALNDAATQAANNTAVPGLNGATPDDLAKSTAAGAQPGADTQQTSDNALAGYGLSPEQLQQAMVQAVQSGNTKELANLKTLYDSMQATAKQSQAGSKLTAAQQTDLQNSKTALSYLATMEQNLKNAGGAGGIAGNLANIPIVGQYLDPKGAAYQATRVDTATALAKAMTGGKPSAQQITQWTNSLPNLTDTPAMVQNKLENIRNSLMGKIQSQSQPVANTSDLASAIQALVGAQ